MTFLNFKFLFIFLSLEYKFIPVFIFFFFLKIYEIELARLIFDHEKDHFWTYRKVRTQNHFQSTLLFTNDYKPSNYIPLLKVLV